jgi:hypothetical protein
MANPQKEAPRSTSHPKPWPKVIATLKVRSGVLEEALTTPALSADRLKKAIQNQENSAVAQFQIAAMDVFVEEARQTLRAQAWKQFVWGIFLASLALVFLAVGCRYIALRSQEVPKQWDNYSMAAHIVSAITFSGLLLLGVAFVMHLARASLHESTINHSRHHALGFGRLYVYLFAGNLNYEQLEKAFGWTGVFPTGFEKMSMNARNPMASTFAAFAEVLKAAKDAGK